MTTLLIILSILLGAILLVFIFLLLMYLFNEKKFKQIAKNTVLYTSDCDGMCNLCDKDLKEICQDKKKTSANVHSN